MGDLLRWVKEYDYQQYYHGRWVLKVYLIKKHEGEYVSDDDVNHIIEMCLSDLEENCISNEFTYHRVGFAFLHYGTRGVNFSVVHFGSWVDTCEMFICSWYCYERNLSRMERLDSCEPVMSQYEYPLFLKELKTVVSKLDNM